MIFQHKKKCKEIFIISEIYLVFHPQNEGPSCLQDACGCLNTNIYKKCSIFYVFFNKHCFKNPTLLLLRGRVHWTPTLIFSKVWHRKIKPNRWVERPPKLRNLNRCHYLLKFGKYEKTTKTTKTYPLTSPSSRGLSKLSNLVRNAVVKKEV